MASGEPKYAQATFAKQRRREREKKKKGVHASNAVDKMVFLTFPILPLPLLPAKFSSDW